MYAVVRTGGKQFRVSPGDVVNVEKLSVEAGATVELTDVLMVSTDQEPPSGLPTSRVPPLSARWSGTARGRDHHLQVQETKLLRRNRGIASASPRFPLHRNLVG